MAVTEPEVNRCPRVEPAFDGDVRPFRELMEDTGLLWLINRTVFHPRGFALALVFADDEREQPLGWQLVGDGTAVWAYDEAEHATEAERFEAAQRTFDEPRVLAFERAQDEWAEAIGELVDRGLVEVVQEGDER